MNQRNAELLRDQVKKTWNPPLGAASSAATIAQTATMQTLAFVFGGEFLGELTFEQTAVIDGGLRLMNGVLLQQVGWQRHPSTLTAHAFVGESTTSACKRTARTNGALEPNPGQFACTRCIRKLGEES